MSGNTQIEVGSEIPLTLSLVDGNEGVYPQVVLRDNNNTTVATVNLSHSINGLYTSAGSTLMPDVAWVVAIYTVYTDTGRTNKSTKYQQASETYIKQADENLKVLIEGIKDKTDQITFTKANEVDVNIQSQNDQELFGSGLPNDKWRGYQ